MYMFWVALTEANAGEVTDVDDVVYDVVVEEGPETTIRTWTRKDTGKLVLTESLDSKTSFPLRHGPTTWAGGPTVRFDMGEPEPSFATSVRSSKLERLSVDLEDKLEILDVDPGAGKLAFRVIDLPHPDEDRHPCAYPGMEDRRAAVELGLLDVPSGKITRWTVYGAADSAAQCTPPAEASRQLAAAKAAFAALGLDVTRKPAPLRPQVTGDQESRRYTLTAAGRAIRLDTERLSRHAAIHEVEYSSMGADPESSTAIGRWSGIAHPPLFLTVNRSGVGSASIAMEGAWEKDGHALVAWTGTYFPCCTTWGFVSVR